MREILFNEKGSYSDWGLILSKKDIGLPPVKTNYVSIPSGDGVLDLTEALRGEVSYGMRPLKFIFTVTQPQSEWSMLEQEINSFLHGREVVIFEPDDLTHYFVGRCEIDSFDPRNNYALLHVTATCHPYRYKTPVTKVTVTLESTETSVILKNERKAVIPMITTSAEITLKFENKTTVVNEGEHQFTSFVLTEGDNLVTISGSSGTVVSFTFNEGAI